jgi:chaperonin GroEL
MANGRAHNHVHATDASFEEDISLDGSVALLPALLVPDRLKICGPDEKIRTRIIRHSIEAPLSQLCGNAGVEDGLLIQNALRLQSSQDYNVALVKFEGLMSAGEVDPTKVNHTRP